MTERIKVQWTRPEIEHDVKGVMAFSPDKETAIPFDGDGYMLNRQKLPEIQNERCKKMGIEFEYEINLTGLIYEGQQAVGVQGIDNKTKQPFKKTAKIVIDATGVTSMLRNQIKNTTKLKRESTDEIWNQLEDTSCILIQHKKILQNLIQIIVLFI